MKIFSLFLTLLLLSSQSHAIKILQSKGNKVLFDLEDETLAVDQKLYLVNASNKKIAIVTVTQSKNGRAIAILNKGKLDGATGIELMAVAPISAEAPTEEGGTAPTKTGEVFRLKGMKISGLLTIGINNMGTKQSDGTLPVPNQEDVALTGTSMGITGAIDYPFISWLTLRGTFGYEPFVAAGTSTIFACSNLTSKSCDANINYLAAGGYARFDLTKSKALAWVGLGGSTKFPISKSTTALRSDDIKMTFTFAVGGGLDYFISNKSFIPASFEYQLFSSSDTVSASIMLVRLGYGWAF